MSLVYAFLGKKDFTSQQHPRINKGTRKTFCLDDTWQLKSQEVLASKYWKLLEEIAQTCPV